MANSAWRGEVTDHSSYVDEAMRMISSNFTLYWSLAQLVRFIVMELTYPGLNIRFDMGVVFTANYSFSGRRRSRRQRDTLGD
jgi:hypothetical protein